MPQKKVKRTLTDKKALDTISEFMSGEEWDADTCDTVAKLVRLTGRDVDEPWEEPECL